MVSTNALQARQRHPARIAAGVLACAALIFFGACSKEDRETHEIKGLKMQVQEAYGEKDFTKGLAASQKGLTLARKVMGDTAPDALYFAQAITENQMGLHNTQGTMRALKQELAMRTAANQKEKKLQSRRTLLIQLAEDNGDTTTAIEQTVIIAKAIGMAPGKDPQPTYQTSPWTAELYRQHVEGDVEMSFGLDADGTPTGVRVSKSTPPNVFDSAALEAFRKWRFTPAIENDMPVSSSGYHFTLAFRLPRTQ